MLTSTPQISEVAPHINWARPPVEVFDEVVHAIARRALEDAFFHRMVEERPLRAEDIAAVAQALGSPIRVAEIQVQLERRQQDALRHLEKQAADFVAASKAELGSRERSYRRIAYGLYSFGLLFGAAAAIYSTWRMVAVQAALVSGQETMRVVELILLSAVGLALVVAVEEYCRRLGRQFMNEATRNTDRIHAISFGEFFLRAYGRNAQWSEVKEAFQHWNIGDKSSFQDAESGSLDPQVVQLAVELAKLIPGTKK